MNFTYTHKPRAEKILLEALLLLRARLDSFPEAAKWLKAVVLGGGYGRGEGGATADGHLYNDLDFWVVLNGSFARSRANPIFKDLQLELAKVVEIDVDFFFIEDLSSFYRISGKTLMAQELFAGHFVAWGDDMVFDEAPRVSFGEIAWREGARLLLNRGKGLLLAMLELSKGQPNMDFIRRNINKAVLGCGDALLIAQGLYRRSGKDRLKAIQELNAEAELYILYEIALMSKYTPNPNEAESLESLEMQHEVALKIYMNVIMEFASILTGKIPPDAIGAIEYLLNYAPQKPAGFLKNLALSVVYAWQSSDLLFPLIEHPRLKLMRPLVRSLLSRREEHGFMSLWRRFN